MIYNVTLNDYVKLYSSCTIYIVLLVMYFIFLDECKIDVSEGVDINKSNKSKECVIFHYWYSKNIGYNFKPNVCNKCHDISMMAYELENTVITNVKGVDYKYIL